jgi:hypothetical protein
MPTTAGTPTSAGSKSRALKRWKHREQKEANNNKDARKGAIPATVIKDASNSGDGSNSTYYRDAIGSKNISNSSGGICSRKIGTSWIATSSGTVATVGILATVLSRQLQGCQQLDARK